MAKCKDCGKMAPLYSIHREGMIGDAVCISCGKICKSCEQPPDRCRCK